MLAISLPISIPILLAIIPQAGMAQQRLPQLQMSDQEIRQFVDEMRQENPPMDIHANFQGHTNSRDTRDQADNPLFEDVNPNELTRRSDSIRQLIKLYDNYEPETGVPEEVNVEERTEVRNFLDTITRSQPMQKLYSLLQQKGHPFGDGPYSFRRSLEQIWFGQYSRARGEPDSSGFEHVFIGEFKNGEVSGLHNWIRFLYLEQNRQVPFDYKGFLIKRENIFGAVKFLWADRLKPTGSFLIGTLPEFDFALYTLCFLARRGRSQSCNFDIDGCPMAVTSFDLIQQGRVFIGSMYPSAGRMTTECRERANANSRGEEAKAKDKVIIMTKCQKSFVGHRKRTY